LAEALDYASRGETGANFYTARGELSCALPYADLRNSALILARRLAGLQLERGSRVALVAATTPDFLRFFFACQYAGLVPVALPAAVHLGGHTAYVEQLRGLLESCNAALAMAPAAFIPFLSEASRKLRLRFIGEPTAFDALPESQTDLKPLGPDETAYIQYTSGSTRFPRGVVISQRSVMSNLAGILQHGIKIRPGDRAGSWLPYYHDMGLVGLVLCPLAAQVSVDYLDTRDFAMRPRRWLTLMSEARATISFSPPFGYELAARRTKPEDAAGYDLSAWRVAGVGAEIIQAKTLQRFAETLAPSGFDPQAFVACYGMAECSLAASFAPLAQGLQVDRVDAEYLAVQQIAKEIDAETAARSPTRISRFVKCGPPLPGHQITIRDGAGVALPERHTGRITVRGPSVMSGYFRQPECTVEALSADGWLDTGDIGYQAEGSIVVTGRRKDLIIIKGRNVWPQDLEYIAENQPEVRSVDASAFSVPGPDGEECAVMVVQCRVQGNAERAALVQRLRRRIHVELGIDCVIELVPPHTLPRTSSGKLSRSEARQGYLDRRETQANVAAAERANPEIKRDRQAV
jgi:fatty-acyl-CoA synthase